MSIRSWGALYGFEIKKILKSRLMTAMLVFLFITILIEAVSPRLMISPEMIEEQMAQNGQQIDDHSESGIRERLESDGLTDAEIKWWESQAGKIEKPYTYYYHEGALNLAQGLTGILLVIFLMSAICVSTVFTVEHRQKTDQIVLSCKHGRLATYYAKIAAGLTVVTGSSILGSALLALIILILSGMDGLNAVVQLEIPQSVYSFTFGQFILIQLVIMITAGILFSTFAMGVSEMLKNSMAVMGLMVGIFIYSQVEIVPPQYRFLSQTRAMLPSNQMSVWSLEEYRLINVGGHYFTGFEASPVVYLIISLILIAAGAFAYNRFQVKGR